MLSRFAADVSTLGGAARANLSNTFVFKDEKAPPKRSGAGGGGGGIGSAGGPVD